MDNKFKFYSALLQIAVGILATLVFIKNSISGGESAITMLSFMLMIIGFANGVRNMRDINRHT